MKRSVAIAAAMLAAAVIFFLWLPEPGVPEPDAWPAQVGNTFVLRDVRVFDGERVHDRADVLVRDGMIEAVGPRVVRPDGAPEFAATGHTLLPALFDAHTHNFGASRRDALRFGVGTQVDMFSYHGALGAAREQRRSLAPVDEADMWSAGTLVTAPGGHGTQFGMRIPTLERAGDADAFVRDRLAEGSDFIKVVYEGGQGWGREIPTLDEAGLAATITAAHERGVSAVVHAGTHAEARAAVLAGADGLVHVFGDEPIDPALVAEMRARGTFIIPTLAILESVSGRASGLADDPRLAPFLSPEQADSVRRGYPPRAHQPALVGQARANVRALHGAGVPILAGSDAPNPGTAHGASLHRELELLVEAGLSNADALRAATSLPAERFAIPERGRVARGHRADLLLVRGDPLVDITASRDIVAVWKNGHRVERQRFDGPSATEAALEDGTLALHAWTPTTDAIMGGASEATLAHADGVLRVDADVRAGAPWPWAGAMRMLRNERMEPVSVERFGRLDLRMRADGPVTVLFFSGAAPQSPPQSWPVQVTGEWQDIVIPLREVPGFDPAHARAVSVVAGPAPARVRIEIATAVLR